MPFSAINYNVVYRSYLEFPFIKCIHALGTMLAALNRLLSPTLPACFSKNMLTWISSQSEK